jgi:hypothetical protein
MEYKLYTDKLENFKAKIQLEGASLKKSKVRLVIESDGFDLMFNGTISKSGVVNVPVKRLKGLLDENTKGKIRLEVIAEDTYFTPWESTFLVEAAKKLTVEIKSQSLDSINESSKPQPSFSLISQPTLTEKQHVINIIRLLIKENINMKSLHIHKNKLNSIVGTYIQKNEITEDQKSPVITKVIKVLEKRK